ncbi:MAG: hypothetical protein PVF17_00090 [Ignavibacteria bacterium]|jgi:hypothetical protein
MSKKENRKVQETDLKEFVRKLESLKEEYNVYFIAGDEWSGVFAVDRDTNEQCKID